jgi:hypothetical protein
VVVICERGGNSVLTVFNTARASLPLPPTEILAEYEKES